LGTPIKATAIFRPYLIELSQTSSWSNIEERSVSKVFGLKENKIQRFRGFALVFGFTENQ